MGNHPPPVSPILLDHVLVSPRKLRCGARQLLAPVKFLNAIVLPCHPQLQNQRGQIALPNNSSIVVFTEIAGALLMHYSRGEKIHIITKHRPLLNRVQTHRKI
jgi:hypothetical protein